MAMQQVVLRSTEDCECVLAQVALRSDRINYFVDPLIRFAQLPGRVLPDNWERVREVVAQSEPLAVAIVEHEFRRPRLVELAPTELVPTAATPQADPDLNPDLDPDPESDFDPDPDSDGEQYPEADRVESPPGTVFVGADDAGGKQSRRLYHLATASTPRAGSRSSTGSVYGDGDGDGDAGPVGEGVGAPLARGGAATDVLHSVDVVATGKGAVGNGNLASQEGDVNVSRHDSQPEQGFVQKMLKRHTVRKRGGSTRSDARGDARGGVTPGTVTPSRGEKASTDASFVDSPYVDPSDTLLGGDLAGGSMHRGMHENGGGGDDGGDGSSDDDGGLDLLTEGSGSRSTLSAGFFRSSRARSVRANVTKKAVTKKAVVKKAVTVNAVPQPTTPQNVRGSPRGGTSTPAGNNTGSERPASAARRDGMTVGTAGGAGAAARSSTSPGGSPNQPTLTRAQRLAIAVDRRKRTRHVIWCEFHFRDVT
jgi:hypothetical protein